MFGQADDAQPNATVDARISVGEHEQFAAASADFLQVALYLFDERAVRCDDDGLGNGCEREWAVFEFACGVGFGVDVADFF